MLEIVDQPARRAEHRAAELAEPVQRGDPVQRHQPRCAARRIECLRRALRRVRNGEPAVLRRHQLGRAQPRECGPERFGCALFQLHPPGRNIAGRDAHAFAHRAHRRQHIGAARFEQRVFGQGSGGDEAHDIARDQRLRTGAFARFLGGFGLFGDGHAAPRADQTGEVILRRMDRNAAHRDRRAAVFAPAGERDIEHAGGNFRVFEEQLEEIAHAVEQQAATGLCLQRKILRHHRSWGMGVHSAGARPAARVSQMIGTGYRHFRAWASLDGLGKTWTGGMLRGECFKMAAGRVR